MLSKLVAMWYTGLLTGFFCFYLIPAHQTEARLVGEVGTALTSRANPADDDPDFFLNTEDPADANGTVSSVQFCFTIPEHNNLNVTTYQATAGFYRRMESTFVLISEPFNLIVPASTVSQRNEDEFECRIANFFPVEVQENDIIGACSVDSFDNNIGHLQLTSRSNSNFPPIRLLFGMILRSERVLPLMCRAGSVPEAVRRSDTDITTRRLQILGNISEIVTATPADTAVPTVTIATEQLEDEGRDTLLMLKIAVPIATLSVVTLIVCLSFVAFLAYVKFQQRSKYDLRVEAYKYSRPEIPLEHNIAYMDRTEVSTHLNSPASEVAEPLPTLLQDSEEYSASNALMHSSQQPYHSYDYIDVQ